MHFNKKVEFIVRFLNCDKVNKQIFNTPKDGIQSNSGIEL